MLFRLVPSRTGSTLASPATCAACSGAGYKVVSQLMRLRRRGSEPCEACGGRGEVSRGLKRCSVCRGSKVATDTKVLELAVEKGVPDGHRITFPGEADVKVRTPPTSDLTEHLELI